MGKGGWERFTPGKACPKPGCQGELFVKALGEEHLALKCTKGDFEKRGSVKGITDWLENN